MTASALRHLINTALECGGISRKNIVLRTNNANHLAQPANTLIYFLLNYQTHLGLLPTLLSIQSMN